MSRSVVLCALLAAVVAVASSPPPLPQAPASDFYLKIKGIDGEAEDGAVALAGLAWDTDADAGQFAVDPPQEVLARYGGAQFASGGMSGMRESAAPRDRGTGMATGQRYHSWQMKITKQYDRATPQLMQACADGTHLDVEVWERDASGQETLRYTLKEAIITSITLSRGDDWISAPVESISFTFDKIEMTPGAAETPAVNLNSSKSN